MIATYIGWWADTALAGIAGWAFGRAFVWCLVYLVGVQGQ